MVNGLTLLWGLPINHTGNNFWNSCTIYWWFLGQLFYQQTFFVHTFLSKPNIAQNFRSVSKIMTLKRVINKSCFPTFYSWKVEKKIKQTQLIFDRKMTLKPNCGQILACLALNSTTAILLIITNEKQLYESDAYAFWQDRMCLTYT